MVVKKETPVKKAPATKAIAKKVTAARAVKGDGYSCEVCGLAVTIDEQCGCIEAHDIICCGEPMTKRVSRAKPKAKPAAKASKK